MTIASYFVAAALGAAAASAAPASACPDEPTERGPRCPAGHERRSPEEVMAERVAALRAGDIDGVMCTYAPDAVVILPGSVARGRDEIRAAFVQFFGLFGAAPEMTSMTIADDVVLITYRADGPMASIPDGADTFVIRHGHIRVQTVHASIVFDPK